MALIQISDPDKSVEFNKEFSVGIDLGTTHSLIAKKEGQNLTFLFCCLLFAGAFVGFSGLPTVIFVGSYVVGFVAIHLNIFKLYLRQFHVKQVYIILYICASEIAPVWLATQTLKF